MDRDRIARWKEAVRLLDAVARPDVSKGQHALAVSRVTQLVDWLGEDACRRWSGATSRLQMRYRDHVAYVPADGVAPRDHGHLVILHVLRLAHAVATDDPGAVPPLDRRWLTDALRRGAGVGTAHGAFAAALEGLDAGTAVRGPDPDVALPETFVFAHPHLETRKVRRHVVRGEGVSWLRRVEADASPVVATLVADGSPRDGHVVSLRMVGDMPYRALCRPGSWDPVGVAEFVDLVGSGTAWADNPFLQRRHRANALVDLDEYACAAKRPRHASEDGLRELTASLRRAGDLVVIDGAVHRHVGTPRLHLACEVPRACSPTGAGARLKVVWTLGCGLASDDVQTRLSPHHGADWRPRGLWVGTEEGELPACLSFGLGDMAQVLALVAWLAQGRPTGGERPVAFESPSVPAHVIDAERFPEDHLAAVRAIAAIEAHRVTASGKVVVDARDPASEAVRAARRTLRGEGSFEEVIRSAATEDIDEVGGYGVQGDRHVKLRLLRGLGVVAARTRDRFQVREDDLSGLVL